MAGTEVDSDDFAVLFVCTANHCRSPMAEFLLRQQLSLRELSWTVRSAGTQAQPGQPMHAVAARILARRGIEVGTWVARSMDEELIDGSDLILAATEAHSGAVGLLRPPAMARTFTLLQFAHLVRAAPLPLPTSGYGRALVAQATRARALVQPMTSKERNLADPMGQSPLKFRRCAATIERSLEDILAGRPLLH